MPFRQTAAPKLLPTERLLVRRCRGVLPVPERQRGQLKIRLRGLTKLFPAERPQVRRCCGVLPEKPQVRRSSGVLPVPERSRARLKQKVLMMSKSRCC